MEMVDGFRKLHEKYEEMFRRNIVSGKIPMRSTRHGFWGPASLFALFDFFTQAQLSNYSHFLDLGSGDGRVVLLASLFTKASGVECDEELVNLSESIKDEMGMDAEFHCHNYMRHNLSDYDFVFINPDKGFSDEFEEKLIKEAGGPVFIYNSIYKPRKLLQGKTYWFDQLPITRFDRPGDKKV